MNKRMREPFHTLMWKASIGYNDSWSQIDPEVLEKFAELIAQECAELCDRFQARDVGMQPAECAGAIRNMFGVKQ